ncbi:dTDP-4-amino-4,6-dideoxygalactose transaminase [Fibrobacter sp. UWR3]|uniref:dTDP-4-amino-4,6-dideoxygalactose transaminase n=1 Tax=Fibrobacter sp. UWR3 TaxID=1896217 RepID=UPI0009171846|nr:dTDP-4-amino-4,6-dideoxygalactose transaminase [Fibrobacter sp. UWR3]SHM55072.1 dTDP-4-amino-4,6-dideoxygalactose transaminase [Fibrobacter sp. UWR3]
MQKIPFNKPPFVGMEFDYVKQAVESGRICGDGTFNLLCHKWLEEHTGTAKALLTTSCTHALEMSARLCNIAPGDEVIMPSFTFVSTADAFVSQGAKCVFVDIRPDTMNLDEKLIEDAITEKTKAIVPVHYAGVACEMDAINEIAKRHNLFVVEDAAQGMMATYKGRALGSLGDFGCYSYHETKNYSMGEGGALLINDPKYNDRAEIIREKGTNRCQFHRGEVDKYTWVELGSSYLPSELNAAYLYAELECADIINDARMASWNAYRERLALLAEKGLVELPYIPEHCTHNAHMFYLKVEDLATRTALLKHLTYNGILAVFHYVPLHSSPAGMRFGRFHGEDKYTTNESNRLLRLPMFYGLKPEEIEYICGKVFEFFGG